MVLVVGGHVTYGQVAQGYRNLYQLIILVGIRLGHIVRTANQLHHR